MKTRNQKRKMGFHVAVVLIALLFNENALIAQKPKIGVLNIEGKGVILNSESLGGLVRIELEKTNVFSVLDWYDIREVLGKQNIDLNNCYGKTCVLEAGSIVKADKMVLGSVERIGERIAIILKIVNVKTGEMEKSNTAEFRNYQEHIQRMVEISVIELVGQVADQKIKQALMVHNDPVESHVTKVNLSGPRIGLFYTDGIAGKRMRADEMPHGGFGMNAVSSMIGWQQEVVYLSSGNFQALLEFLFTGAGIESGRFIPAFTFLNGFRLGKQGWEIALGPTFRVVRKAKGYYMVNKETKKFDPVEDWYLSSEIMPDNGKIRTHEMENLDSRGKPRLSTGLLIAAGKTFTSGSLNIPVNVYCIPRKDGTVYGMSVGFNVFKSKRN